MSIQKAFDNFLADRETLEAAILSSTRASWGGGHYTVELFEDGTYRVLAGHHIGNLYQSPGMLLQIPRLTEDEWDGTDDSEAFFDNAIDQLRDTFAER